MTFISHRRSDDARQIATDIKHGDTDLTSVEILLCNLTLIPDDEPLTITFNNQLLRRNSLPSASKLLSAVELLVEVGIVTWTKGQRGKRDMHQLHLISPLPLIDPTSIYTLIPDQIIVKGKPNKNDERKVIKTPFNRASRQMEKDLDLINSVLRNAKIRFPMIHLYPDLDPTSKQLYRIFHEDLKNHGRFYGGFWENTPAVHRPYITIDGEPTVELDYKSMHPMMLYQIVGAKAPDNLYQITGYTRKLVKSLFLILINADNESGAMAALRDKHPEYARLTNDFLQPVIDKIRQAHAPIKNYLGTGAGRWLMFLDSTIANRVLMHFAKQGIPVLPVHDSFIVATQHRRELDRVMRESFDAVLAEEVLKSRPRDPRDLGDTCLTDTQPQQLFDLVSLAI